MAYDVKNQIKQRMNSDEDQFSDAFVSLSEVITGSQYLDLFSDKQAEQATEAVDAILAYFGIQNKKEIPSSVKTFEQRMDYLLRPEGIMRRHVKLKEGWYEDAIGTYMGTLKNGTVIALIPRGDSYFYVDNTSGKTVPVNKKTAGEINEDAMCFYIPLPQKKMTTKDFMAFVIKNLHKEDYIKIAICTLIVTLISMVSPIITEYLYNEVIYQDSLVPLYAIFVFLATASIGSIGFNIIKSFGILRIQTRVDQAINSAIMMRIFNLPVGFFKKYQAGNLASRSMSGMNIASTTIDAIFSTGFTTIVGLLYVAEISKFSSFLAVPAFLLLLVQFVFSVLTVTIHTKIKTQIREANAGEQGFVLSAFTGMQKIKLSGSERRIFAGWAEKYKAVANLIYNPPVFMKYNAVISTFISAVGAIILYMSAYMNNVSAASYMAFLAAYGLLSGSFATLTAGAVSFSDVPSALTMLQPIFEQEPEVYSNRRVVTKLKGRIEMDNISFRYDTTMPMVIDNLSLKINSGSYVAIVGRSGCGKSTLMRLLLGFEEPQKGQIFYDGIDINKYDMGSLRRRIGTVMQTSGLFPGTIKENVSVAAPKCSEEDIWKALEMAGIADDVRDMPMGLNTIVSENTGGVSGGQRQRLIIARAIIGKPDILFFDEATSALDNITQKIVADSLETLKCTRVVIAHRLSTVKGCDRIIMLDGGKIVEDGTYDELIALNGQFAELVKRQQI